MQLLSNRAQSSLDLNNYRSCILDCDAAMGLLASRLATDSSIISIASKQKIHFRKCKALVSVRRWRDCIHACNAAEEDLKGDPSQLKVTSSIHSIPFLSRFFVEDVHILVPQAIRSVA